MNTGEKVETERLWLVPGLHARDGKAFLKMLAEEGDLRAFCGADYSEKLLKSFENYFERSELEECYYVLFPKENPKELIGCAGIHKERHYEIEVYISKPYRNRGYCEEAAKKVIELLFSGRLRADGKVIAADEMYALTLADNEPTFHVLRKLGFEKTAEDSFYGNPLVEYVLKKAK